MRVRPIRHLVESAALFRAHPLTSAALGAAMAVSVCALCCGLGFVAVPWFGCELYAFQVHAATGERPARTRSWIAAGVFVLGGTLIVTSAGWLSTLGLDVRAPDPALPAAAAAADPRHALVSAAGGLFALLFVMPFTYAPRILVDRGGTLGAAVLESGRFFVRDGFFAHVGLAILSHVVQTAPVSIAVVVALSMSDESAIPLALLAGLPFMVLTVPLGQGIVTSAWVARRERLVDARAVTDAGRTPRALVALLCAALLAPPASLALLVGSLARPSALREGRAPEGEVAAELDVAGGETRTAVTGTALSLEASAGDVAIVASDGGGVGSLPLRSESPVDGARVVRVRDVYFVEVAAGGPVYLTRIDRAGVRLDDDLRARLSDRLPSWGPVALAFVLFLTPLILLRVSVALAELRAASARADVSPPELAETRRRALALAWAAAGVLVPLGALALATGALALAGA